MKIILHILLSLSLSGALRRNTVEKIIYWRLLSDSTPKMRNRNDSRFSSVLTFKRCQSQIFYENVLDAWKSIACGSILIFYSFFSLFLFSRLGLVQSFRRTFMPTDKYRFSWCRISISRKWKLDIWREW